MKLPFAVTLLLLLTGCIGAVTLDTSSPKAIQFSSEHMLQDLPEAKHEAFLKALAHFQFEALSKYITFDDERVTGNKIPSDYLDHINGLTGEQIITLYNKQLAQEKLRKTEP